MRMERLAVLGRAPATAQSLAAIRTPHDGASGANSLDAIKREQRAESRRAESREQRAESREQRAESREAESRELKLYQPPRRSTPRLSRCRSPRPTEFPPPLAGDPPCADESRAAHLPAASGEPSAGRPPGAPVPLARTRGPKRALPKRATRGRGTSTGLRAILTRPGVLLAISTAVARRNWALTVDVLWNLLGMGGRSRTVPAVAMTGAGVGLGVVSPGTSEAVSEGGRGESVELARNTRASGAGSLDPRLNSSCRSDGPSRGGGISRRWRSIGQFRTAPIGARSIRNCQSLLQPETSRLGRWSRHAVRSYKRRRRPEGRSVFRPYVWNGNPGNSSGTAASATSGSWMVSGLRRVVRRVFTGRRKRCACRCSGKQLGTVP